MTTGDCKRLLEQLGQPEVAESGTAAYWLGRLDSWNGAGVIRPNTRRWVGVDQFLNRAEGEVTRGELAEFVRGQDMPLRSVDRLAKQSHTEHRHLVESRSAATLVLMTSIDESALKGLVLDQVCKELGYGGWHAWLTSTQVAHAVAVFDAQEYGPGMGPSVRPVTYRPYDADMPNALLEIKLAMVKGADGSDVAVITGVDSPWHREGRLLGYGQAGNDSSPGVPDAPMKDPRDWVLRALKEAVRWAATRGATQLAWLDGMQKCRADLRAFKGCSMRLNRLDEGNVDYQVLRSDGWMLLQGRRGTEEVLAHLGKSAAAIVAAAPLGVSVHEGVEVTIQGEENNLIHDRVLPGIALPWAQAYGADLRETVVAIDLFEMVRTLPDNTRERVSCHLSEQEALQRLQTYRRPDLSVEPVTVSYAAYAFPITPALRLAAGLSVLSDEPLDDLPDVAMRSGARQ